MLYTGKNGEHLELHHIDANNCELLKERIESGLMLMWFLDDTSELILDGQTQKFKTNEIVCLTEFHQIKTKRVGNIRMVRFNRAFYCVHKDHSEIGCKGLLFFGAAQLPRFVLPIEEEQKFVDLWQSFEEELGTSGDHHFEMLQIMLTRLLILCTRLYKDQCQLCSLEREQLDTVREFNYLVEENFKTTHTVAQYADMMAKSPKTLSNLFSKLGKKTPLQYIHERKLLEARRQLQNTNTPIKEVAYAIGFEDQQAFSRFFKKNQGVSPKEYRIQSS